MNNTGTTTLYTPRLTLRRFTLEDAQYMFDNWADDEKTVEYMTWNRHGDVSVTRNILSSWVEQYENDEYYHWCVVLNEISQPIGAIHIFGINMKHEKASAGYCYGSRFWGNGYAGEALRAVAGYMFEQVGINRLEAQHHVNNRASGRVMEKAGMRFEGVFRQYNKDKNGKFYDMAQYALLRSDWDAQKAQSIIPVEQSQ